MADFIYDSWLEYAGDNTMDMDGGGFKACLLDDGHSPSAAHTQYSEVSGDELSAGGGYSTGGVALTSDDWSHSGGTTKLDFGNAVWGPGASFTARYMVVYHVASLKLVCLFDFTENKTVSNGTFTYNFHTSGLINIS